MGPSKFRLSTGAAACAVILSGCFDMKQDLAVAEDGTAEFKIELSVDAAILAMGSQSKPDNFCNQAAAPAPEGITMTMERTTERGDVICKMNIAGSLDAMAEMMAKGLTVPGVEEQQTEAAAGSKILISREGENYRFEVAMPMDMAPANQENSSFDATPMLAAMFAGRSLSWTVSAPEIIETSGALSDDGRTSTYSFPLALALQEGNTGAEFYVVFKPGRSKFLGIF